MGWIWGYELDEPTDYRDDYNDSAMKYKCDHCKGSKIIKIWAWEWGRLLDDMKRKLNGRK